MVRQAPAERLTGVRLPPAPPTMRLGRLLIVAGIIAALGIVTLLDGDLLLSSKAALSVTSDPSEQKVYLDDQEIGSTPFFSDNLTKGESTLVFGEFSQRIKLTAGALTVVNWILGPAESFSAGEIVWFSSSSTGTELLVISKPAAEVFLGGESIGDSPLSKEVQPGEYDLEIKKEGYFSRTLKIAVKEGYRLNVSVNLSLDPFPAEETEVNAGGEKIKVMNLSSAEPLLLADFALWVRGAAFWAEKDEEKSYNYFLTGEGKLYDPDGSEVSLTSLSKQTEAITVGYLGESDQGLSANASTTLGELQVALFPTPKPEYQVLILETGYGYLNVRSGPGRNHSKIGTATPGDRYEYLGKSNDWFKIKFQEKEGWVFSNANQYAEKVKT